jgi:deoxyribonuclease-4
MHSTPCLLGAHTSASGGSFQALLQGREIGATTIQLFTSNQKQWTGRHISKEELLLWEKALAETNIESVMSHDSYLINLGSPKEEILSKSIEAFKNEILRCHLLNLKFLNFHPGTATDGNIEFCLDRIVKSLLELEETINRGKTILLLEATAGQGNTVGYQFSHLRKIIESVKGLIPIGVCIDTCHIFAAGYDIRTKEAWNKTLDEFDQSVGLSYLKAFHVNDSVKCLGSRVDRHANLGEGEIGLDSFRFLMSSPRVKHIPKYLETPGGPDQWKKEIALLKQFAEES